MFDFIQKVIYFVLSLQEKFLRNRLKKNFKPVYIYGTSKKTFGQAVSIEFNTKTKKNKIKLQDNLQTILKKYKNNPEKLLGFVERSGTKVYRIKFADKLLKVIGYEKGFIGATKGIKSLYLNLLISTISNEKLNYSLKTEPMFVLDSSHLDNYYIIQNFHKWYAMKLNLPGFDCESQSNFQKFLYSSNDEKIKELSVDEILGLKEAIARDVEAINFVVNLAKSTAGSKKALEKMTAGGASI